MLVARPLVAPHAAFSAAARRLRVALRLTIRSRSVRIGLVVVRKAQFEAPIPAPRGQRLRRPFLCALDVRAAHLLDHVTDQGEMAFRVDCENLAVRGVPRRDTRALLENPLASKMGHN